MKTSKIKTTKNKDHQKLRQPKIKTTKNEDDQKIARPYNRHDIDNVATRFVFT